jgi:hypothetical protein
MTTLYDEDFYAWTQEQAHLLREGNLGGLDAEKLAEEIESLGKSQQQELETRLGILLAHMLKWEFQPDKRSSSWAGTIKEQRRRIRKLLNKMPSLKACLEESITDGYEFAVISASTETMMVEEDFPSKCPYAEEQILGE